MNPYGEPGGLAVVCGADGVVERVVRDDVGFGAAIGPGRGFDAVAPHESRSRLRLFLRAVARGGAAFGWEIQLEPGGRPTLFRLTGASVGERLLVAAVPVADERDRLIEALIGVNNEQANSLRAARKSLHARRRGR